MSTNDWVCQQANNCDVDELFYKNTFLPVWSPMYGNDTETSYRGRQPYVYLPDHLKLRDYNFNAHDANEYLMDGYANRLAIDRTEFEIGTVCHFTNGYGDRGIQNQGVIQAHKKRFASELTYDMAQHDYRFVWFTGTVANGNCRYAAKNGLRNHSHEMWNLLADCEYDTGSTYEYVYIRKYLGTSSPFTLNGFQYHPDLDVTYEFDLIDLLDEYQSMMNTNRVFLRCLGTSVYKQEVMHTVIVLPHNAKLNEDEQNMFMSCDRVPSSYDCDAETVAYRERNELIWKPYSTSGFFMGRQKMLYCRWEQLAVAFYFPRERDYDGFDLNNLNYNRSLL